MCSSKGVLCFGWFGRVVLVRGLRPVPPCFWSAGGGAPVGGMVRAEDAGLCALEIRGLSPRAPVCFVSLWRSWVPAVVDWGSIWGFLRLCSFWVSFLRGDLCGFVVGGWCCCALGCCTGIVFFSIGSLVGALACVWFRALPTRYWRGEVGDCSRMMGGGVGADVTGLCSASILAPVHTSGV